MKVDPWSHVVFITVGFPEDAFHRQWKDRIGIRFDEETHEFRGAVLVIVDHQPVALPILARFTLLDEALSPVPNSVP